MLSAVASPPPSPTSEVSGEEWLSGFVAKELQGELGDFDNGKWTKCSTDAVQNS